MRDNFEKKGPSRRDVLRGMAAVAGTAAVGGSIINQANAQNLPPGYDKMIDAARELYGLDKKSLERKAHFDAFEKVEQKIKKQYGRLPQDWEYKQELDSTFRIYNWNSPEGKRFEEYLQEWK